MSTTTAAETRAEQIVKRYAEQLKAAGWTVTIRIVDHEPERYTHSGEIMLPGMCSVSLSASRAWYDPHLHGHWISLTEVAAGRHRSTSYRGGGVRYLTSGELKLDIQRRFGYYVETLCCTNVEDQPGTVKTERITR